MIAQANLYSTKRVPTTCRTMALSKILRINSYKLVDIKRKFYRFHRLNNNEVLKIHNDEVLGVTSKN